MIWKLVRWNDDKLIITESQKISKQFDLRVAFILPAIDITDILIKGDDSFGIYSVQIEVWDDFGAYIGPKTLWIVNAA
ncbi:MAG: hypothetical protein Q8M06_05595 [Methanobacteriaceae archaeon]|nr:hypothetical protein [Methanobacteriaceae archaeon]MDZ4172204.1 hypothetical protein [Methanobacteriaceae archaeon]